jgi:hypothetical protein
MNDIYKFFTAKKNKTELAKIDRIYGVDGLFHSIIYTNYINNKRHYLFEHIKTVDETHRYMTYYEESPFSDYIGRTTKPHIDNQKVRLNVLRHLFSTYLHTLVLNKNQIKVFVKEMATSIKMFMNYKDVPNFTEDTDAPDSPEDVSDETSPVKLESIEEKMSIIDELKQLKGTMAIAMNRVEEIIKRLEEGTL